MKPLIVVLAICMLGYVADHWHELAHQHQAMVSDDTHGLIIYGAKSSGPCVQLENELNKRGIAHERRDLSKDENLHELTEKFARVGKMKGSFVVPVAEVDGVLYEGMTIDQLVKHLR